MKASALVGGEFTDRLQYYADAWLPARDIVAAGLNARKNADSTGKIILFEAYAPWKAGPAPASRMTLADVPRRSIFSSWRPISPSQRPKSPFT